MSVKKYCYCENNCKYETLDKEEILAAIAQAVETGTVGECDTGFITTIKTINGQPLKFFVGEQSEYEALTEEEKKNLFAIITNDTTKEGLLSSIEELQRDTTELREGLASGDIVVKNAENAKYYLFDEKYYQLLGRRVIWSGRENIYGNSVTLTFNESIENLFLVFEIEYTKNSISATYRTMPIAMKWGSSRKNYIPIYAYYNNNNEYITGYMMIEFASSNPKQINVITPLNGSADSIKLLRVFEENY